MFKKSINLFVITLAAMGLSGYLSVATAADSKAFPTLLVVPSNYTAVQLAFDVAKMRSEVFVVSYSAAGVKVGQPLYIWVPNGSAWVKTTFADYSSGNIFAVKPGRVIIIGNEKDVPPVLGEVSAWCSNVKRIPTFVILDVINSLNESFNFTVSEWRWLAKEYDLKIEDKNIERRRYGKYGKPGETTRIPMPVAPVPADAKTDSKVEKPVAPVMIQSEVPETTTKKKSAPENK